MLPVVVLQVPPGARSTRLTVPPGHMVVPPVMLPAVKNAPTVTTLVVLAVPQLVVTVYFTVSVPGLIPVSNPVLLLIVACALVTLHTPALLLVPSAMVVVVPEHTLDAPVIVPAVAVGFTVITSVAAQPDVFV